MPIVKVVGRSSRHYNTLVAAGLEKLGSGPPGAVGQLYPATGGDFSTGMDPNTMG